MSYYREQLETWLKTIDVNAETVFDVGGGSNPVSGRVKSWNVQDYNIIDNDLEATATVPSGATRHVFDLNYDKLSKDSVLRGKADVLFCLEVMEYVFEPSQALKTMAAMLKKGGVLYITFPFVYPVHNPSDADMLRYTPGAALGYVVGAGFLNTKVEWRKDRSGLLPSFYKTDGMHVAGFSDVTGIIIKATKS